MNYYIACLECKDVFSVKFPSHARAFCTIKCKEPHYPIENCKLCGNPFKKRTHNNRYCSTECYRKTYSDPEIGVTYNSSHYFKMRFMILKRDGFKCQYCGRNPQEDNIKLHVDHIVPRNKGGAYSMDNLVTACSTCNIGKSDVLLELKEAKNGKKS